MKPNNTVWMMIILTLMMGMSFCVRAGSEVKVIPLYIGHHKFTVEVADTPSKWTLGLMYREYIADDFGMLFISTYEEHRSFWMKNCKVHLDIIFLDRTKQIINIHHNVPPCTADPCPGYPSARPAQFVLELRANRAKELNLKPGDRISFSY